jgi:hypothetical protein
VQVTSRHAMLRAALLDRVGAPLQAHARPARPGRDLASARCPASRARLIPPLDAPAHHRVGIAVVLAIDAQHHPGNRRPPRPGAGSSHSAQASRLPPCGPRRDRRRFSASSM